MVFKTSIHSPAMVFPLQMIRRRANKGNTITTVTWIMMVINKGFQDKLIIFQYKTLGFPLQLNFNGTGYTRAPQPCGALVYGIHNPQSESAFIGAQAWLGSGEWAE